MTTAAYAELGRRCKRRGYTPLNVETLHMAVTLSIIYKFKRPYNLSAWQYEVEMPGYGNPPKKENWVDVEIIGRNE